MMPWVPLSVCDPRYDHVLSLFGVYGLNTALNTVHLLYTHLCMFCL